jgi:hypothetical protein
MRTRERRRLPDQTEGRGMTRTQNRVQTRRESESGSQINDRKRNKVERAVRTGCGIPPCFIHARGRCPLHHARMDGHLSQRKAIIMKRSRIKVAAVAAILALSGVGLAHDALAWGRFHGSHFGHGKRFASKFDGQDGRVTVTYDQDRRETVTYDRDRRVTVRSPAWSCRCTELDCCDR